MVIRFLRSDSAAFTWAHDTGSEVVIAPAASSEMSSDVINVSESSMVLLLIHRDDVAIDATNVDT
jgi:hypothetical protein